MECHIRNESQGGFAMANSLRNSEFLLFTQEKLGRQDEKLEIGNVIANDC